MNNKQTPFQPHSSGLHIIRCIASLQRTVSLHPATSYDDISSSSRMITRSRARAIQQAQNGADPHTATTTRTPPRTPRMGGVRQQIRRPIPTLAGNNGHIQQPRAEVDAALLAAVNHVAAEQDQANLAEATANEQPINEPLFDAAMLERLVTLKARLDLMRTSCKTAWVYFRITTMACQASIGFQQKFASTSSFLPFDQVGCRFGAWPGTVASALLVLLLHLFNVLCLRRI